MKWIGNTAYQIWSIYINSKLHDFQLIASWIKILNKKNSLWTVQSNLKVGKVKGDLRVDVVGVLLDSSRISWMSVFVNQWPKPTSLVTVRFVVWVGQRPLLNVSPLLSPCFLLVSAVLPLKGKKPQNIWKMINIWASVSVKHMVNICLLQQDTSTGTLSNISMIGLKLAMKERKMPLTAHIFCLIQRITKKKSRL